MKRKREVHPPPIPRWLQTLAEEQPPTPPSEKAPPAYIGTLRSYQQRALGFANHRLRTMLALDCGLGKTHIGLAYSAMHLPALVICPASLQSNWHEHILSFVPSIAAQITVQSYNKMRILDRQHPPACLVVDEAHYLKHESSQRSKTFVQSLLRQCPRALLLTGTPAQRNADLFHLLKILDPVNFQHFFHYGFRKDPAAFYFAERYTVPKPVWIGGARHGYKFTTNTHVAELGKVCAHYMLRLKKSDVVTLPELATTPVHLGEVENRAYFTQRIREIEDVRVERGNRRADVEMLALCRETSQRKLSLAGEYIRHWIQTHRDQKVILFYHHKDIGDQIEKSLQHLQTTCIRIDGKIPVKKRVGLIRRFRDDPTCNVGVLSMCATSTGLNLQFCCKIIFIELTFLSVHHTQAEARIHRIGQEQTVSVDYLLLDGTTDSMLWHSLCAKRRNEARLFGEEEKEEGRETKQREQIVPL